MSDITINFIRTTSQKWATLSSKSGYNDSIVFIEDIKQIWSNGKYYGVRECYASDFVATTGDACYQIQGIDSDDYFIWRDIYHMYDLFGTTFSFIPNALYKVIGPNENGEDACTYKPVWFYDKVIIYNNSGSNSILDEIACGENEIPSELINNYTGDIFDQYGNEYIYNKEKNKFYPKFSKSYFSKSSSGSIGISMGPPSLGYFLTTSGSVGVATQPLTVDPTISDTLKILTDRKLILNGNGTIELNLDSDGVKSNDFYDEYGNIRDTVRSKYSFYGSSKSATGQIVYLLPFDANFTKVLSNNDIISIIFPSTYGFNNTSIINWLSSNTPILQINNLNIPVYYNMGTTIRQAFIDIRSSLGTDICFFLTDTPYLFYYYSNKLIWLHQQGAGALNYYIQNTYQNVDGSVVNIDSTGSRGGSITLAEYTINGVNGSIKQHGLSFSGADESNNEHPILFKDFGSNNEYLSGKNSLWLNIDNLTYNNFTQTISTPNILIRNELLYGADSDYTNLSTIIKNRDTGKYISILDDTITGNLNGNAASATNADYASIANEVGEALSITKGTDTISYNGSSAVDIKIPIMTPSTGLQSSRPSTFASTAPYWGSYPITESLYLQLRTADDKNLGGIKVTSSDDVLAGGIDCPVWLNNSVAYVTVPNPNEANNGDKFYVNGFLNDDDSIKYSSQIYIQLYTISDIPARMIFSNHYSPNETTYLDCNGLKCRDSQYSYNMVCSYATVGVSNATYTDNGKLTVLKQVNVGNKITLVDGLLSIGSGYDYVNPYTKITNEDILVGILTGDNALKSTITKESVESTQFISTQPSPETITNATNRKGNIKCPNNSYTKENPIFTVETGDGKVYGFFIENSASIAVGQTGYCDIVRLK